MNTDAKAQPLDDGAGPRAPLEADEAERQRRAYANLIEGQRLSQTGSFTWDFQRGELLWSEELCRIFEFDPEAVITTDLVERFVHPDDLPAHQAAVEGAAAGKEVDISYRIVTASGVLKHLHAVGHRIEHDGERPVYIGATQDVTDRKIAEEALSKARAELAHVARAATLSALTASIAHEVNQPLTSLVTNASTCVRMLTADPPNLELARTTAQRTIRDANRASEVISRLRAMFARRQPAMEPVDLNQAAAEVLALSAGELQGAGVVVRTDFAEALPAVLGDRIQLQQVILNLVLNAIDAMRAVDGPRGLRIATAFDRPGPVRLTVRDEGTGIGPGALEKLFDAFYTTKSHGMGIGLSISQSIIQAHDGRLWAASNDDGPGATFSFSIPCGDAGASDLFPKDL
jgi:PAS domain S-box-containing protein